MSGELLVKQLCFGQILFILVGTQFVSKVMGGGDVLTLNSR